MRICQLSLLLLALISAPFMLAHAQLSNPITRDSHAFDADNKFLQRAAAPDDEGLPPLDEEAKANSQCPSNIELRWQTEVASSIYSTPLIADINGDGKSEVVVPSFVHYLEVLEGADGEKLPGWPAFHKSSAHTSPLLHDVDADGLPEILLATYNGEVLVFDYEGQLSDSKVVVPRLRVRKEWYAGLDPDHVDHAHPDIQAKILDEGVDLATEDEAAAKAAGLPDHLLNLPHRADPRLEKPATQEQGHDPPMPDHLPGEPLSTADAGNATADCDDVTCSSKGHGGIPGLVQPASSGTGSEAGSATGSGAQAAADVGVAGEKGGTVGLDAAGLVTNGTHEEVALTAGAAATIAAGTDVGTTGGGGASGVAAGGGAGSGATEGGSIQTETTQAGGTGGADPGRPVDPAVAAGGDAARVAADVAAVQPTEMSAEQKALQESWERWHDELAAKNHTMTAEQQQKWDQFVAWREKQRQGQGQGQAEAAQRRRLLQAGGGAAEGGQAEEDKDGEGRKDDAEAVVEPDGELDEEAAASWDVFKDEENGAEEGVPDEYHYDYDEYANSDDMWADEDWTETDHETDQEYIGIDSHILCTPVVADIDNDGQKELIVAASYFFDREYYEDPAHKSELEEGIDISKYIAGAVVVFDMSTDKMKWNVHLDLTTESTQFRGYIYSAPTVVDLDGDGFMEILVGTSVGFIYCLGHDGTLREGFPIQMGEIQGQVIAADVNGDGQLEIVAGDTKGNVAVFDRDGKEIWERHTASLIAQGATVGDVDGDGQTEVVITTTGGHVWVLNGKTGEDHGAFPFRAHGRIMVPALLVNLRKDKKPGLDIVVISFDGYLYIIDGRTGCADAIDVGETSYSMVLADQVDGGDDLDLIVSTMNGNVYCFQTPTPFHPLKAWSSQNQGANVPFPRHGTEGIFVLPHSRQFRDVSRESFVVQFEIVDNRAPAAGGRKGGPYDVSVWLLVFAERKLLVHKSYDRPGVYTVAVECPPYRTRGAIRVEMFDEHKLYFYDEFVVTFNMYFYRILKWLLVLPMLAMVFVLVVKSAPDTLGGAALPSFRGNSYLP